MAMSGARTDIFQIDLDSPLIYKSPDIAYSANSCRLWSALRCSLMLRWTKPSAMWLSSHMYIYSLPPPLPTSSPRAITRHNGEIDEVFAGQWAVGGVAGFWAPPHNRRPWRHQLDLSRDGEQGGACRERLGLWPWSQTQRGSDRASYSAVLTGYKLTAHKWHRFVLWKNFIRTKES